MQLAFDIVLTDPGKLFSDPPDLPNDLVCAYCGQGGMKLGKYPKRGGRGWKEGVNFHPYCKEDLIRYGSH